MFKFINDMKFDPEKNLQKRQVYTMYIKIMSIYSLKFSERFKILWKFIKAGVKLFENNRFVIVRLELN